MPRIAPAGCLLALLLAASPAAADLWFDIGGGQPVTVYATGDPESWERYPPYPFGPYPAGSLVYQDMRRVPCEALWAPDLICGSGAFIRGFTVYFSSGVCGCAGVLWKPTQLRFCYDPEAVLAAGADEEGLQLLYRDEILTGWIVLRDAFLDLQNHRFDLTWAGNILGWRQFAIVTYDVTPVGAESWGRIKALYRR